MGLGLWNKDIWCLCAQASRPTDMSLLDEMSKRLEAKEALVERLRILNDEAGAGMHMDEAGQQTQAFQQQYTSVILQLKVCTRVMRTFSFSSFVVEEKRL